MKTAPFCQLSKTPPTSHPLQHQYTQHLITKNKNKDNTMNKEINKVMDDRKIVVVVEESETARTALKWALQNLVRYGDVVTLLHLCPYYPPRSRNKKKIRLLRLKGYQLALSFKDICTSSSFNTKIEIVVTEDDAEGEKMVGLVREIGAFALVLGLHDRSFFYRLAMRHDNITKTLNCKVLAIKQPMPSCTSSSSATLTSAKSNACITQLEASLTLDFSQIEVAPLQVPSIIPQKIPYQICPNPSAIIWRSKKTRRRSHRIT